MAYLWSCLCIAAIASSWIGRAYGSTQYCHNDARIPVHFCVAVQTSQNASTSSTDLYLTFGYSRSSYGGWTAVGLGNEMLGALIFAVYAETSSNSTPIVSPRYGRGHWEPKVSEELPYIQTLKASSNHSGWIEASIACYSCDNWVTVDTSATDQPWIWATNNLLEMTEVSIHSSLSYHQFYGHFTTNRDDALENPKDIAIPVIDFNRGDDSSATGTQENSSSSGTSFGPHGTLIAIATMLIYPSGAIAIRTRGKYSFHWHSGLQALGTVMAIYGIVGLIINADQPIGLGIAHHRSLLVSEPASNIASSHVVIGRIIVVGGACISLIGLAQEGGSKSIMGVTTAVAIADIAMVFHISYRFLRDDSKGEESQYGEVNQVLMDDVGDGVDE
ncbi:hypothetical protein GGS23DRAFT_618823 [Durotheca rogersii]|uniref:uncharacterized protein n=1 Tax=Durotheca rogersii TaxID=419775 RepID=UPI002220CE03|nr:uncharacterized protein GGS23DRAFT_618823 [Durotheca rogersii]KAI5865667.1 hypothetical protein GGS23DRAFT_618823 [Durotheca rogersii]